MAGGQALAHDPPARLEGRGYGESRNPCLFQNERVWQFGEVKRLVSKNPLQGNVAQ